MNVFICVKHDLLIRPIQKTYTCNSLVPKE